MAAEASDDWWIIGSAAIALHGFPVTPVRDVDLLMSARDAEIFMKRVGGGGRTGPPSAKFRSAVFGTWRAPPLPVEVMGGFALAAANGWQPVVPRSREAKRVGDQELFVPSVPDLKAMLMAFGRPKDLERALLVS